MDKLINELLQIEKHPGTMLGGKSLSNLHYYIAGYSACLYTYSYDTHILSPFTDFVQTKYNTINSFGWYGVIKNETSNEIDAFDLFYKLLHEFLSTHKQ